MIYNQSVFDPWPIERESVQAVITSPPYFALRKYDIPDVVIGGDKDCKHEFVLQDMELGHENRQGKGSNTLNQSTTSHVAVHGKKVGKQGLCVHCKAWQGQYGLEPTPQMYVEHTLLWAKEAWRVLRNDGMFFLNIADSYGSVFSFADNKYKAMAGSESCFKPSINKSKCQFLIPHRVAIALVDAGWTLRNTIIWDKTNAMPESVTDRFSKKYEYVFMFTKQKKYYFNLNAVLEDFAKSSYGRGKAACNSIKPEMGNKIGGYITSKKQKEWHRKLLSGELKGKNSGDVWRIPTQRSSEKHYAMFPERLVERMIKCSTKAKDIVLDPFCGSGTTLKVALVLNRRSIGIDLGYRNLQNKKTSIIQRYIYE